MKLRRSKPSVVPIEVPNDLSDLTLAEINSYISQMIFMQVPYLRSDFTRLINERDIREGRVCVSGKHRKNIKVCNCET